MIEACLGDPLVIRGLVPATDDTHALLGSVQLGAMAAITLELLAGEPGDYLYGDHHEAWL